MNSSNAIYENTYSTNTSSGGPWYQPPTSPNIWQTSTTSPSTITVSSPNVTGPTYQYINPYTTLVPIIASLVKLLDEHFHVYIENTVLFTTYPNLEANHEAYIDAIRDEYDTNFVDLLYALESIFYEQSIKDVYSGGWSFGSSGTITTSGSIVTTSNATTYSSADVDVGASALEEVVATTEERIADIMDTLFVCIITGRYDIDTQKMKQHTDKYKVFRKLATGSLMFDIKDKETNDGV